jgi:hypothetical protein
MGDRSSQKWVGTQNLLNEQHSLRSDSSIYLIKLEKLLWAQLIDSKAVSLNIRQVRKPAIFSLFGLWKGSLSTEPFNTFCSLQHL